MNTDHNTPHKGIYLLPNLFTTAGLFSGFYAIIAAMNDKFEVAAIAVFIAMVLDGLDGRVARWTNTQSEFGAQYDSLADLVSFGLAPSLVVFQWALVHMKEVGVAWGKLGWMAAFIYVACAALRLARFNVQHEEIDKRYFIGLPSPAAAALMVGMVWVFNNLNVSGNSVQILALLMTFFAGLLMVSNIKFNSFKDFNFSSKVPHLFILVIVLVFAFIAIDPAKVLFAVFLLYAVSGPVLWVVEKLSKPKQPKIQKK
ncbi:MAG: CDP-diacylglycerol--serine O-phosphatidyltransferase [Cocleimonas sp.]|nr:CDP-diacylglycerol--serine O-phosphatidyltransferase [Cocleimonas sp.]